jgi:magnesium-transporting ATPase (P-type)
MLKRFILLVFFCSIALVGFSFVMQIFHKPWLYLTIYATILGLIPSGLAYLVLTVGRKND